MIVIVPALLCWMLATIYAGQEKRMYEALREYEKAVADYENAIRKYDEESEFLKDCKDQMNRFGLAVLREDVSLCYDRVLAAKAKLRGEYV